MGVIVGLRDGFIVGSTLGENVGITVGVYVGDILTVSGKLTPLALCKAVELEAFATATNVVRKLPLLTDSSIPAVTAA